MKGSNNGRHAWPWLLLGLAAVATPGLVGCQVDVGGQTLPSPYYMQDDVQYFPPSAEFKLAKEAAAQKAYAQDVAAQH